MKRRWIALCTAAAIGFIPAMQASADVTTSISGEYRLRAEFRDNADFAKTSATNVTDQQNFYGQRVRVGLDAKINPDMGGFIQFQDTRNWGDDDILTDKSGEKVDIHQAFITIKNIKGLPLNLKVGRQELSYGDQRLVGAFGWSNQGRAFDAIKLMYSHEIADIDFWTAKVDENNSCAGAVGCAETAAGGPNEDTDFYGIYATFGKLIPDNNLQAYLLYKKAGTEKIKTTDGVDAIELKDLTEYTLGARLAGKVASIGIDYTGELAFQSGDTKIPALSTSTYDISAYAFAIEAGYAIPNIAWSPRIAVEYDYATGTSDSDITNKEINTFDNLYPTNHPLYGFMDYQGWRNMSDISLKVSAKPSDKCDVYVAYHMLSLADKEDNWYAASGRINPFSDPDLKADDIGNEIDIVGKHTFNKNLKVEGGLSLFSAGDVIEKSVKDDGNSVDDSTWAYLMGTVSF